MKAFTNALRSGGADLSAYEVSDNVEVADDCRRQAKLRASERERRWGLRRDLMEIKEINCASMTAEGFTLFSGFQRF